MLPFRASLLLFLCLAWSALAQQSAAPQPPKCAVTCLSKGFQTGLCGPADKACICTNHDFQAVVTKCVATTCTIPDVLAAKNASMTSCGAPVRSHGHDYIILSNVMISVAAGFVAVRFVYKLFIARLDIGYDDWSVLATLIAATPSAVITVFGTVKHGLGRDMWTLTPDEITKMLKYFYIMASLYFTQVALLKLSLIFFYIRVFPSPGVQRLLWGTVIFSVLWGFTFVVTVIFQCRPISYFWTHWDGLHKGHCLDINAITSSNAAISIALDLWIIGIPLWQLWGLKLHWKRKVGVALMFCVGTFVTVVSILRLQALVTFAASSNASWDFYNVSVWSTIEICVGIMCACLPTIRLLLVQLFPVLGGSSARSKQQKYYQYGSELRNIDQSKSRKSRITDGRSFGSYGPKSPGLAPDHSIMCETSYTVQHSKTSQTSLVSHDIEKS